MSNPVLDSVTPAGPVNAQVGQSVVLTAVGHDDDTRHAVVKLKMVDNENNESAVTNVDFQFDDGLKLVATCDDPKVTLTVNGFAVTVKG